MLLSFQTFVYLLHKLTLMSNAANWSILFVLILDIKFIMLKKFNLDHNMSCGLSGMPNGYGFKEDLQLDLQIVRVFRSFNSGFIRCVNKAWKSLRVSERVLKPQKPSDSLQESCYRVPVKSFRWVLPNIATTGVVKLMGTIRHYLSALGSKITTRYSKSINWELSVTDWLIGWSPVCNCFNGRNGKDI